MPPTDWCSPLRPFVLDARPLAPGKWTKSFLAGSILELAEDAEAGASLVVDEEHGRLRLWRVDDGPPIAVAGQATPAGAAVQLDLRNGIAYRDV